MFNDFDGLFDNPDDASQNPNELDFDSMLGMDNAEEAVSDSNPLFLYGGVGLGKTHLMYAIAWQIKQNKPNRRVVYISAEKFMNNFISAIRNNDVLGFKERFRNVDVLMIDDVQFISGKDSTQEEFFHTFNALIEQKKQLVISADRSPAELDGIKDRIKSRLGCGLVADIHQTTYELRHGILKAKAERMGVDVPDEVYSFLASKITSNVRELEGAFNKVMAHANLMGNPVTLEYTRNILKDLLRASERVVSIEDIQKAVSDHFNVRLSEMFSAKRARAIARPRQIAMYLCKEMTTKSLPDIGRKFGGRDHTTVIHAVKTIKKLETSDPEVTEDINIIKRILG